MKRAVRSVLRLLAAGAVVVGGMELGLEFTRHRLRGTTASVWHCLLGALIVLAGVALFAASDRLARTLTDDFEE
jgi:hypothetical protein